MVIDAKTLDGLLRTASRDVYGAAREAAAEIVEARADDAALDDFHDRAFGRDDDAPDPRRGCGADDRFDTRGNRVRRLGELNDAGEPHGYC